MRTAPLLLILLLSTQPKALLAQYRGRVLAQSGEPLRGVTVTDNIFYRVTTDTEGRFKLDDPNPRSNLSIGKLFHCSHRFRTTASNRSSIVPLVDRDKDSQRDG